MIVRADALHLPLEDDSVDLIVTSPPYFALRSYRDGGEHYDGQIGSEPSPQAFLEALWKVTEECKRVLKPTGSIFVNLGDKYVSTGGALVPPGHKGPRPETEHEQHQAWTKKPEMSGYGRLAEIRDNQGWKDANQYTTTVRSKSLMGLPWRYAIGCIDHLDLILRAEIVWSKPNGLPESVADRVRRSHEQWFHLVKEPRYFTGLDEIREPYADVSLARMAAGFSAETGWRSNDGRADGTGDHNGAGTDYAEPNPLGKIPGSVWTIPSEPLTIPQWAREKYNLPEHFAAFPQEWPRRLIQGWAPTAICTACGEGRRPATHKTPMEWTPSGRNNPSIRRTPCCLTHSESQKPSMARWPPINERVSSGTVSPDSVP